MKKDVLKMIKNVLKDKKITSNISKDIQIQFEVTENFIDLLAHLDNRIPIQLDKQLGIYEDLSNFYTEYFNDNPSNYISSSFMKVNRMSKRFSSIIEGGENNSSLRLFQYGMDNVDFNYFNIIHDHIRLGVPFLVVDTEFKGDLRIFVIPFSYPSNELVEDFIHYVLNEIKKYEKESVSC